MNRLCISIALIAFAGCSAFQQEAPTILKGRLVLEVVPNPIEAVPAGEDVYDLKFDIVMREEGGVGVRIEDFTVEAIAFNAVPVRKQRFPASYITVRGYPADVAAGKYLRFSFTKRWQLPSRLLMSGASARVTARTVDENGRHGESFVKVGIRVRSAARIGGAPQKLQCFLPHERFAHTSVRAGSALIRVEPARHRRA